VLQCLRSSMARTAILAAATAAVLITTVAPAHAIRATVLKNGEVSCRTVPGEIPGVGSLELPRATLVFRPNGSVVLTCHGSLPTGTSFEETFVGPAICEPVGKGKIVVTKSGRVLATCHFPAGTF
jgi:hypothetical protein